MKLHTTTKITTLVVLTAVLAVLCTSLVVSGLWHGAARASAAASSDPIAVGNWQYDQFDSIIVAQAQANGVDPFVIKGQIMLESGFNQYAQSTVINSACGWTHDVGLMQVNPYCAGVSASSLFNAATNIQMGTGADGRLFRQFGDMNLALQAYNIGAGSVAAGQRNWAYSSAVDNYAQQFRNEHSALYGSSGSPSPSPSLSPPQSSSSPGTYTVQTGDTLYSIGSRYGVSWQSIAQANGISYPYLIYVGEHLHIGASSSSSSTYTVQSGDTLWAIGSRYGVSWQSIAQANGISSPYLIYAGEHLIIP
ncbi:MAG TPA: LysM peptidoglycan-binding domain-containing protein [Nitrososphaerales archaeon]|nr:LysM peptidoglycan-binding domain-containing protein [Nitrososphaerales archaeon]